jgi:hypothetical protein
MGRRLQKTGIGEIFKVPPQWEGTLFHVDLEQ